MKAYMTIKHGSVIIGTLHIDLFEKEVPRTVQNFVTLLRNQDVDEPNKYLGSIFHRIIPGFMAQGGDFTNQDGTGSYSIFGETFDDENFLYRHDTAGTLSMANSGPNTNGSQFFITFRPTPHLDRKHVVFGKVNLHESKDVLLALERVRTMEGDRPCEAVSIHACGVIDNKQLESPPNLSNPVISHKDEKETEDIHSMPQELVEEVDRRTLPTTKDDAINVRLRRLRQNMKTARQLNNKALREEGENLGNNNNNSHRKNQWNASNNKDTIAMKSGAKQSQVPTSTILQYAKSELVDQALLTEPAAASLERMLKKEEATKLNQYEVNDYHNPEGQYRNYLRNVKSLPVATDEEAIIIGTEQRERDGARRLATEMHRRIEKRKKRARQQTVKEISENKNVSHINQRNKRFNEKINRTYDTQTAEIRDNLERGTAL
jgi:cyclophilin family peptidyl-prolyl cis-trans isomerase